MTIRLSVICAEHGMAFSKLDAMRLPGQSSPAAPFAHCCPRVPVPASNKDPESVLPIRVNQETMNDCPLGLQHIGR
jgi:hypothetical protein